MFSGSRSNMLFGIEINLSSLNLAVTGTIFTLIGGYISARFLRKTYSFYYLLKAKRFQKTFLPLKRRLDWEQEFHKERVFSSDNTIFHDFIDGAQGIGKTSVIEDLLTKESFSRPLLKFHISEDILNPNEIGLIHIFNKKALENFYQDALSELLNNLRIIRYLRNPFGNFIVLMMGSTPIFLYWGLYLYISILPFQIILSILLAPTILFIPIGLNFLIKRSVPLIVIDDIQQLFLENKETYHKLKFMSVIRRFSDEGLAKIVYLSSHGNVESELRNYSGMNTRLRVHSLVEMDQKIFLEFIHSINPNLVKQKLGIKDNISTEEINKHFTKFYNVFGGNIRVLIGYLVFQGSLDEYIKKATIYFDIDSLYYDLNENQKHEFLFILNHLTLYNSLSLKEQIINSTIRVLLVKNLIRLNYSKREFEFNSIIIKTIIKQWINDFKERSRKK